MRGRTDGIDRALRRGFTTIKEVCHHLNDVVEKTAQMIFKVAEMSTKLKGRPYNAVVSAVVFIACRKSCQSRSLQEIAEVLHCDKIAMSKCYELIKANSA